MKRNQRKRRYVDKEVQRTLVLQTIGLWLTLVGGMFGLLFLAEWMLSDPTASLASHARSVWGRHGLVFTAMLAMLPAVVNQLLKVSNRFAGPVARVRGELRRYAAGKPVQPIKLRKGDFWQGLAADMNAALARANAASFDADAADDETDEELATNAATEEAACETVGV